MLDSFYDFGLNPIIHVGFLESKLTKRNVPRVRLRHKKKTFDREKLTIGLQYPRTWEVPSVPVDTDGRSSSHVARKYPGDESCGEVTVE